VLQSRDLIIDSVWIYQQSDICGSAGLAVVVTISAISRIVKPVAAV
jgi:hypothetical protein